MFSKFGYYLKIVQIIVNNTYQILKLQTNQFYCVYKMLRIVSSKYSRYLTTSCYWIYRGWFGGYLDKDYRYSQVVDRDVWNNKYNIIV